MTVPDDRSRHFMEMLTAHQRDLYAYVNMLLAGDSAAADVVQDTNMALWANMELFDFDRPFIPWAMRFAYNQVLAHRKSCGRSRLVFSDEFVEALSHDCMAEPLRSDDRLAALRSCLDKLPQDHRQLVNQRYQGTHSVKTIAAKMGSTPNSVSAQLYRIRKMLADCIERRLSTTDGGHAV